MYSRKRRKGQYFEIDAMVAIGLLIVGLIYVKSLTVQQPQIEQNEQYSQEAVKILRSLKVGDLNSDILKLINESDLAIYTSMNFSIAKQISIYHFKGNQTLAQNITRTILDSLIPRDYGYEVVIRSDVDGAINESVIYNNNVTQNERKSVAVSKTMITGLQQTKPIIGKLARIYLGDVKNNLNEYEFFGGFVGNGDIRFNITLPKNSQPKHVFFEGVLGDNVNVSVNKVKCDKINKTYNDSNVTLEKITMIYLDDMCVDRLHDGENEVMFDFPSQDSINTSYIASGFLRVNYDSENITKDTSNKTKKYLPGIKGQINIYDSVFFDGDVENISMYLHFNKSSSGNMIVNFAGDEIYSNSEIHEFRKNITPEEINSSLDFSKFGHKTVPLRIGEVESNGTGIADIVLLTDRSDSMKECMGPMQKAKYYLKLHLKADDNPYAKDYSGNGFDGYFNGDVYSDGDAFVFDGWGDYINLGDVLDPGSNMWSVCLWFNADTITGEKMLYEKEGIYMAGVRFNKVEYAWKPYWNWNGPDKSVDAGEWYHYCTVYDKEKQYAYLDGHLIGSRVQTGDIGSNGNSFIIGARRSSSPYNFFKGKIQDVMIFDAAIDNNTVNKLFEAGRGNGEQIYDEYVSGPNEGKEPSEGVAPLLYMKGEEVGGKAKDYSDNGFDGEFKNGAKSENGVFVFDGSGDEIKISNDGKLDFDSSSEYSFSMWIYNNDLYLDNGVLVTNGEYSLGFVGGNLYFYSRSDCEGYASTNDVPAEKWTNVIVTYSNQNVTIYTNGDFSYSDNRETFSDSNGDVILGTDDFHCSGIGYYDGMIDNIIIFNKSLTDDQVKSIYGLGREYEVNELESITKLYNMDPELDNMKPIRVDNNESCLSDCEDGACAYTDNTTYIFQGFRNSTAIGENLGCGGGQYYNPFWCDINHPLCNYIKGQIAPTASCNPDTENCECYCGEHPDYKDLWWDNKWSYRFKVNVTAQEAMTDKTASFDIDFDKLLEDFGCAGCEFDPDSVRVVEYDDNFGVPIDEENPTKFNIGKLEAYWSADGTTCVGSGDNLVLEDVERSNDGSGVGNLSCGPGRVGNAILFEGEGGYIDIPGFNIDGNSDYTFNFWMKQDEYQVASYLPLINNYGDLYIVKDEGTSSLELYAADSLRANNGALEPYKNWYFVSAVYDASTTNSKIYINAVDETSDGMTGNLFSGKGIFIGGEPGYADAYLRGSMDEISIYSLALSQSQINDLMNNNPIEYNYSLRVMLEGDTSAGETRHYYVYFDKKKSGMENNESHSLGALGNVDIQLGEIQNFSGSYTDWTSGTCSGDPYCIDNLDIGSWVDGECAGGTCDERCIEYTDWVDGNCSIGESFCTDVCQEWLQNPDWGLADESRCPYGNLSGGCFANSSTIDWTTGNYWIDKCYYNNIAGACYNYTYSIRQFVGGDFECSADSTNLYMNYTGKCEKYYALTDLPVNYDCSSGCSKIIWQDDFEDGRKGYEYSHASDIDDWVIEGGVLKYKRNDIDKMAYFGDETWVNYTISLDLVVGDDDMQGILFRYQDSNNYYRLAIENSNTKDIKFLLRRFKGGGNTLLKTKDFGDDYVLGQSVNVKVSVNGAEIKIYINYGSGDKLFYSGIDSQSVQKGGAGLWCRYQNYCGFDNIKVISSTLSNKGCGYGHNIGSECIRVVDPDIKSYNRIDCPHNNDTDTCSHEITNSTFEEMDFGGTCNDFGPYCPYQNASGLCSFDISTDCTVWKEGGEGSCCLKGNVHDELYGYLENDWLYTDYKDISTSYGDYIYYDYDYRSKDTAYKMNDCKDQKQNCSLVQHRDLDPQKKTCTVSPSCYTVDNTFTLCLNATSDEYACSINDPKKDPSIVLKYGFDRYNNSIIEDYGPYGNDGYVFGTALEKQGAVGSGFNIIAKSGYVHTGSVGISGNAPRTIAGWVKSSKTNYDGWSNIFGFHGNVETNDHYFDFEVNKWKDKYTLHLYGTDFTLIPVDTEWHFLAATYDGSDIKAYVDGVIKASQTRDLLTDDNFRIGQRLNVAYFNGVIDEVTLWARALSDTEIAALYNSYVKEEKTLEECQVYGEPTQFNPESVFKSDEASCFTDYCYYNNIDKLCIACNPIRSELSKTLDNFFVDRVLTQGGNKVALIGYGDDVENCGPQLYKFTDNQTNLSNTIDQYLSNCGATCIPCAMKKAIELLNDTADDRQKMIVLMSDGDANIWLDEVGNTYYEQIPVKAPEQVINMSGQACKDNNISVVAISFGTNEGADTLRKAAEENTKYGCTGVFCQGTSDPKSIRDCYLQAASLVLYHLQTIGATLSDEPSELFPDSYVEYTLNKTKIDVPDKVVKIMSETERFGNINPSDPCADISIDLGGFSLVEEAKLTSYSGNYWTSNVKLNDEDIFNLADYDDIFRDLGDPFIVGVPTEKLPNDKKYKIRMRIAEKGITTESLCSGYDRMVYTAYLPRSYTEYSEVLERAQGCKWNISFSDGTDKILKVPLDYSGNKQCNFSNDEYDSEDVIDVIMYKFLKRLSGGDNLVDISIDQEDIETDVQTINQIPFMWGPALLEVRVWK